MEQNKTECGQVDPGKNENKTVQGNIGTQSRYKTSRFEQNPLSTFWKIKVQNSSVYDSNIFDDVISLIKMTDTKVK